MHVKNRKEEGELENMLICLKGPAWAMRSINVISINVASVGSEFINVILMNMVSHQSSMR